MYAPNAVFKIEIMFRGILSKKTRLEPIKCVLSKQHSNNIGTR